MMIFLYIFFIILRRDKTRSQKKIHGDLDCDWPRLSHFFFLPPQSPPSPTTSRRGSKLTILYNISSGILYIFFSSSLSSSRVEMYFRRIAFLLAGPSLPLAPGWRNERAPPSLLTRDECRVWFFFFLPSFLHY